MSEARIKVLKKQSANCKRLLTNFGKYLDNFVLERDFPSLVKRIEQSDKNREEFESIQSELDELEDNILFNENVRNEFDDSYWAAYNKATIISNNVSSVNNISPSAVFQSITNENKDRIINDIQRVSKSKLPSITLPSFSGKYDAWLGFHDLFNSLVHNNNELSDIEKLYHLKGCLEGKAADVLASLEISSENYAVAWELLKERYDNRKVIREGHAKSLLNLPVVSKEYSVRSLLDEVLKHVRALKSLNETVETWNTLLIVIIKEKLTQFLREKWEEYSSESKHPSFEQMVTFLQIRAQIEDTKVGQNSQNSSKGKLSYNHQSKTNSQGTYAVTATSPSCAYCQGNHFIYSCKAFAELSSHDRFSVVKRAALCLNCLRPNHRLSECTKSSCQKCQKRHNTLLHFDKAIPQEAIKSRSSSPKNNLVSLHSHFSSEVLLATAVVHLTNAKGESKRFRAFLDAGSQANFITERAASILNLYRKPVDISVHGIENNCTNIRHSTSAIVRSKVNNYSKHLDFLVVPSITKTMPSIFINRNTFEIPKNIVLADPEFYKPSTIDLLIGATLFYKLLCVGQRQLKNHPNAILQRTKFGWIIAGEINGKISDTNSIQCHLVTHSTPLDANLVKFWEIEEIPPVRILSEEEQLCENHFIENTQRNENGRYIVKLPFNEKVVNLGHSRVIAQRRFTYLENRLHKDPELRREYSTFMNEYESLNHMSIVTPENAKATGYYLPHHAIRKETSITTKIRVVFDGSAKTSSGISLNDTLMIGPTIQDDIFTLIVRFRTHKYALTADIEKMYRQILVHPEDTKYQKILYRNTQIDSINTFHLNTVTYGTSCAPFLAIRVLHQLANDEGGEHPIAAGILKRDFYVDDLLSGSNTLEDATHLKRDLTLLLKKGGFHIRKWSSNDSSIISSESNYDSIEHLSLDPNSTIKTLGIQWTPNKDILSYSINISDSNSKITKRTILSQIAKLYDPLGLLGPVIVTAKIFIQLLWKANISWDSSLPQDLHLTWCDYKTQLSVLRKLSFDRCVIIHNAKNIQMHGFCDASERAYGACIYLRSMDDRGNCQVTLVCSKSRVAPLKPLTIPRLELCAALLLANLYAATKQSLSFNYNKVNFWSDSTITLQWIKTEPHVLKTFVSNRVAKIQELTSSIDWKHVSSEDNPADLVSRGQMPQDLVKSTLWKHGPSWLSSGEDVWPHYNWCIQELPECRVISTNFVCFSLKIKSEDLLLKYSSFNKLTRVVAYILRFVHNMRNSPSRHRGPLKLAELQEAIVIIIQLVQYSRFSSEINRLKRGEAIHNKSRLLPLSPFIDSAGTLRVGGRLINSSLPESQKHPVVLPSDHYITKIIIREEHFRLKHAGAQATLYSIREKYWPLNGRNITKGIIRQCIICFRVKHHLLRIVGNTLLTYEQLETLIIEIEAILNSRPISPMSSDPNDFLPLTPGHFLIGGPLTSFPQQLRQHFWKRWHAEYLHQLTTRTKWKLAANQQIKIGTLVIIKEDNASPLQWTLGRIIQTHPGKDGIVRVVTLKTPTGTLKRPIQKICPLPLEEGCDSQEPEHFD